MRKIITIDCDYLQPQFAATYLVHEGGEAYFVETNTQYAVPKMLEVLRREGLAPENVRYVFITHVHLDHAGGAARLMEACPNAQLIAHPRAAQHLVDPSRLEQSARKVYGDEAFDSLYGALKGVPEGRVRSVEDGARVNFADTSLTVLHTRGHANHHYCLMDPALSGVFTGDSFGLAYPALQKKGLFIFPSTSPTDFDAFEAKKSIERIVATGMKKIFLTHFGELTEIDPAAEQLTAYLELSEALLSKVATAAEYEQELRRYLERNLQERGIQLAAADWELIRMDIELNAAGLAWVAEKRRKAKT